MNKRGVTLIELLIVMIIIAILSVVIFVTMTGALDDAKCANAKENVSNLQSMLKQCQAWQLMNSSDLYDFYNCSGVQEQIDQANIESEQKCKKDQLNRTNEFNISEDNKSFNLTNNSFPENPMPPVIDDTNEFEESESPPEEPAPDTECGNCECEEGEDDCPNDCGSCGDGFCSNCSDLNENTRTCPDDCE